MFSYNFRRSSFQYSSNSIPCSARQKYSSSICSNSRDRNVKLRGLISLRNALPICAMPDGNFLRGFGTKVGQRRFVFGRADVSLEHQIEGARRRQQRPIFWIKLSRQRMFLFDCFDFFTEEHGSCKASILVKLCG